MLTNGNSQNRSVMESTEEIIGNLVCTKLQLIVIENSTEENGRMKKKSPQLSG